MKWRCFALSLVFLAQFFAQKHSNWYHCKVTMKSRSLANWKRRSRMVTTANPLSSLPIMSRHVDQFHNHSKIWGNRQRWLWRDWSSCGLAGECQVRLFQTCRDLGPCHSGIIDPDFGASAAAAGEALPPAAAGTQQQTQHTRTPRQAPATETPVTEGLTQIAGLSSRSW